MNPPPSPNGAELHQDHDDAKSACNHGNDQPRSKIACQCDIRKVAMEEDRLCEKMEQSSIVAHSPHEQPEMTQIEQGKPDRTCTLETPDELLETADDYLETPVDDADVDEVDLDDISLTLLTLPPEILWHVFTFLDTRFVITQMSLVCKQLYGLLNDDITWKARISRRWPKRYPIINQG